MTRKHSFGQQGNQTNFYPQSHNSAEFQGNHNVAMPNPDAMRSRARSNEFFRGTSRVPDRNASQMCSEGFIAQFSDVAIQGNFHSESINQKIFVGTELMDTGKSDFKIPKKSRHSTEFVSATSETTTTTVNWHQRQLPPVHPVHPVHPGNGSHSLHQGNRTPKKRGNVHSSHGKEDWVDERKRGKREHRKKRNSQDHKKKVEGEKGVEHAGEQIQVEEEDPEMKQRPMGVYVPPHQRRTVSVSSMEDVGEEKPRRRQIKEKTVKGARKSAPVVPLPPPTEVLLDFGDDGSNGEATKFAEDKQKGDVDMREELAHLPFSVQPVKKLPSKPAHPPITMKEQKREGKAPQKAQLPPGNPGRFGSAGCCEEEEEGEKMETSSIGTTVDEKKRVKVSSDDVRATQLQQSHRGVAKSHAKKGAVVSPMVIAGGRKSQTAKVTPIVKKRERISMNGEASNQQPENGAEPPMLLNASTEAYIDSHCHLDFIYNRLKGGDLGEWMKKYSRSFPANFYGCIPNFIEPCLFIEGLEAGKYDRDWIFEQVKDPKVLGASYGCHPHYSSQWSEEVNAFLEECCMKRETSRIIAIGECGYDFKKCRSSFEEQTVAFARQLQLATKAGLPVIIHCRSGPSMDAESSCLKVMTEHLSRFHNVHRHCFTEGWDVAQEWMKLFPNVMFGYTSVVHSWSRDSPQFEAFMRIPLGNIILETDAPYFRPEQFDRSACNVPKVSLPGMAIAVAAYIAETRGLSLDEVLRRTRQNTQRIYILPQTE